MVECTIRALILFHSLCQCICTEQKQKIEGEKKDSNSKASDCTTPKKANTHDNTGSMSINMRSFVKFQNIISYIIHPGPLRDCKPDEAAV